MRRLSRAAATLAGATLIASCSGGAGSTTSAPSTTLPPATTTTSLASTTTTVLPSTTTSAETTTTLLAGNWAEVPLVIAASGALGWWDGESWIQVETDTDLPISGGEEYQLALLGGGGLITGGGQTEDCSFTLPQPAVELSDPDLFSNASFGSGVAVSAPWNLTPHFFQEESDDGTYSALAKPVLETLGLSVDAPVIRQVVRLDIQGDGVDEVVVVADDHPLGFGPGDYTVVFLRELVDGEVVTTIVDSWITDTEFDEYGSDSIVSAVADLNGDMKMEIVLSGWAYESWGVGVWEHAGEGMGLVKQLGIGCGV